MDKLKIKHKGGNNMSREQLKELLPIIQAAVEGKAIEFRDSDHKYWQELTVPAFNLDVYKYRIKPEPKYRPFANAEDCWQEMLRHEPFGWVKTDEGYEPIWHVNKDDDFSATLESCTFADGTPFGIKEE